MPVTLLLHNPAPAEGMPEYVKASYNTQEEARNQAVADLATGARGHNTGYVPERILDESNSTLIDRPDLVTAADALRAEIEAAAEKAPTGEITTAELDRIVADYLARL